MSLNRYLKLLEQFNYSKCLNSKHKKRLLVLSTDSNDLIINCSIAHVLVKLGHKVTLYIQNSSESLKKNNNELSFQRMFTSLLKVIKKNEIYVEYQKRITVKNRYISVKLKKKNLSSE